jgi:iron complex transport system ATP-binding protein
VVSPIIWSCAIFAPQELPVGVITALTGAPFFRLSATTAEASSVLMTLVRISNLSVGYNGRPVLHGVSLDIRAGEVVALVGPNGAGKSTLVRAISGIVAIRGGTIRLGAIDVLRLPPLERASLMAVVPQAVNLPEAFTVAEIVLMGRTPHVPPWGREGQRDRAMAWEAMRRTGVAALANRCVGEISGGERQRAVIARALAQEPRVLLLDEPTAHLDLKHQVAVLELVRSLAHTHGLAVLATLHDLNHAALYADHIAVLAAGRIVASGLAGEVFAPGPLSAAFGVPVVVSTHPVHGTPLVAPLANGK